MYACKMINTSQACIKEIVNGFEISIAFDDSCIESSVLFRGDIRIYQGNVDITENFSTQTTIIASIENLIEIYRWCKNQENAE